MKFYVCLILSFILISNTSFAFQWNKCKKVFKDDDEFTWDVTALKSFFSSTTSSTQFTTSTGDCAMIGQIDHDKKVFIAHNAEFLQIDIARGAGEYLHNFASISKCDEHKLKPLLKKNYQRIFSSDELNPEMIYKNIDEVIRENNQNGDLCSVGVS